MLNRMPNFIDPLAFAERQRQLQGVLPISEFKRLASYLANDDSLLEIELNFKKERRLATIEGHLQANLELICQNCLAPMVWSNTIKINLAIIKSLEQADLLAAEYEPLLLEEEKVSLVLMLEDEILLSLPDFPRHEHTCISNYADKKNLAANEQVATKPNPFAVLAQLKFNGD